MHAWARKTILISCEIKGCLTFRSFIDIYFIAGADALNQYRAVAFTFKGAARYSNGVALATSKIIILFVLVCIFHV
jgi:hypothetical protein